MGRTWVKGMKGSRDEVENWNQEPLLLFKILKNAL